MCSQILAYCDCNHCIMQSYYNGSALRTLVLTRIAEKQDCDVILSHSLFQSTLKDILQGVAIICLPKEDAMRNSFVQVESPITVSVRGIQYTFTAKARLDPIMRGCNHELPTSSATSSSPSSSGSNVYVVSTATHVVLNRWDLHISISNTDCQSETLVTHQLLQSPQFNINWSFPEKLSLIRGLFQSLFQYDHEVPSCGSVGYSLFAAAMSSSLLLFGPSGNGKTTIIRHLTAASGATLICVRAGEVAARSYNEGKSKVDLVLEAIRTAIVGSPSVLLLDDIMNLDDTSLKVAAFLTESMIVTL